MYSCFLTTIIFTNHANLFQTPDVELKLVAFRRKLIEIQKKPMNVQLSLADFYRIGLEKDYEVGISTTISNNTPNSSKIAKKQTPVKTSISTNANISSIETSSKIL